MGPKTKPVKSAAYYNSNPVISSASMTNSL